MKTLITGSSGEIGTNLALKLLRERHVVFGIDIRENPWTDKFPTIIQDLSQKFPASDSATGIGGVIYPDNIDLVVHLAANAKVHELVVHPDRAADNIIMTLNVLEFCRKRKLPIILASSREIYGDLRCDTTEESQTHILQTESPYSASKISGEVFLYAYSKCFGIPYLAFRFSNVYGRYDNDLERMERVIPLFIDRVSRDEKVTVFGKEKILDFTYVDDCIEGIFRGILKLTSGEITGETINIAYGQGHSLSELVEIICQALNKKPVIEFKPARIGEITKYVANISKATRLLNFKPRVDLEKGINLAIENYKKFPPKYKPPR